jgi:very-short-patch-repair endonuclease
MPDKNPNRVEAARELRRRIPDPERYLWSLLRNRKLAGLKFRRQVPIGPFIVDFYCEAAMLAVELDGASHDNRGAYDKSRQRYLEAAGIKVFRVQNEELLEDMEAVLIGIAKTAHIDLRAFHHKSRDEAQARSEPARDPLTPNPSPQGEGDRPTAGGRRKINSPRGNRSPKLH